MNCKQKEFNKDYSKESCPRAKSQGVPGTLQVTSQPVVLFVKEELKWGGGPPDPLA